MKLIKPSIEVVSKIDTTSLISLTKEIEIAARNCYKSEDKIAEGTDIEMCNKLINRHHYAMLEFGDNIILHISVKFYDNLCVDDNIRYSIAYSKDINKTQHGLKYFVFTEREEGYVMSGNLRAYIELNNAYINNVIYNDIPIVFRNLFKTDITRNTFDEEDIKIIVIDELSVEERFYHETLVARVVCDRGVSHELVRHEGEFSFAQESTRYCNYGNDHIQFIIPNWMGFGEGIYTYNARTLIIDGMDHFHDNHKMEATIDRLTWLDVMATAELTYNKILKEGWSPQEARSVLPNSLKTEIVMKGTLQAWYWLFHERTASGAHPQMKELMIPFYEQVKSINKYLVL